MSMTPALTLAAVAAFLPCADRIAFARAVLARHGAGPITARQAADAGIPFGDLVWAATAAAPTDPNIERRLRLWAADCAARVLHRYESQYPGDSRVRDAIVAARQCARGEITEAAWDAAWAAWDAARAAARAAAWDAARAAWAAARAAWAAAQAAARDARAAWAAAAGVTARAAEETWQFGRLVERLSDPEPDDWPLDATQADAGEGR